MRTKGRVWSKQTSFEIKGATASAGAGAVTGPPALDAPRQDSNLRPSAWEADESCGRRVKIPRQETAASAAELPLDKPGRLGF